MRAALVVTLLFAAIPAAEAAPRVAVSPFSGRSGAECARRVEEILATESMSIVPWTQVKTGASFRTFEALSAWLESKKGDIGADVIVLGNVLGRGVILQAYDVESRALIGLEKINTRGGCRLSRRGVGLVKGWIRRALDKPMLIAEAPPPPPPPEPPPPPPPEPEVVDELEPEVEPPPPPPPPPPPRVAPETATATVTATPPPPPPRAPRRRLLVEATLELGLHRRSLGFEGVFTDNLRAFDIGAMPVPGVAARVFFLRSMGQSWLDPVFARVRFARAAFISARRPDGGPAHDATHDRMEARFGYRIRVPASVPVMVSPSVGLHVMRFSLDTADTGRSEPDLPDVSYLSLYLGGDVEAVVVEKTTLLLSFAVLPVLSGGPILSPGFFPDGSARGFEVAAGLRYSVTSRFSVVLLGDYLTYALSLGASPGDTRVATNGQDSVIGLRTGVRAIF